MKKINFYYQNIPPNTWGNNCRQILDKNSWKLVRDTVMLKTHHICSWCKITEMQLHDKYKKESNFKKRVLKCNLHLHEKFIFEGNKQILVEFIPLCNTCHSSTHIRQTIYKYTDIPGHIEKHIKKLTKKPCRADINRFIKECRKNKTKYEVDLSYLDEFAVKNNIELKSTWLKLDRFNINSPTNIKLRERDTKII